MTKEEIIKAICTEVRDYRFTHDEMMRMTKKQLLEYYPPAEVRTGRWTNVEVYKKR